MAENNTDMDVLERQISLLSRYILPLFKEKERRLIIGTLAVAMGRGGVSVISEISGVARNTVSKSRDEVQELIDSIEGITGEMDDANTESVSDDEASAHSAEVTEDIPDDPLITISLEEFVELYDGIKKLSEFTDRQRKPGGGRKNETEKHPEIVAAIVELLEKNTYGNPESTIRYTNLSDRKIAATLETEYGITVSRTLVNKVIKNEGWTKQQNRKLIQVGEKHEDRNAQFEHINETSERFLKEGNPVLSIDCKKKENLGNFANKGTEYRHAKDPREVLDHDFVIPELGKVAPYGVYVVNNNTGFVNLGISHDTCEFAVASLRAWWYTVGKNTFPTASMIYITCDGGGSNSCRIRMFKTELAALADEIGIPIYVSHFPPGTSKWNKIEHRLFSEISKNWAGKTLVNVKTVVQLIGSTTTTAGLKVICKPDFNNYETGKKATEEDLERVNIEWIKVGKSNNWNYIIHGFKKT